MASQSTVERYRDAAIALLPPGEALSKRVQGAVAEVLEALAVPFAELHESAERLLVNHDPAQAVEMLPEWEAALQTGAQGTTAERQAALIDKLRGRTSHAKSVFEQAAVDLGYGEETWFPIYPSDPAVVGSVFPTVAPPIRSGRWRIKFTPRLSSSAAGYASPNFLVRVEPSGQSLVFYSDGSSAFIYVSIGGPGLIEATWSAGQQLTLDVDALARTVTLSGATTGNSTLTSPASAGLWPWEDGALHIGQFAPGSFVFDGSIDAIETFSMSGIEFVTYPAFAAGTAAAGDALYGDEWANTVSMYVPVDEQTADDALLEAFELRRRSHGFLDINLEGPMGAERTSQLWKNQATLSASDTVANLPSVPVRYEGYVSIQALVASATSIATATPAAPSDAPLGTWELYFSGDGALFTRLNRSDIDAELAKIKPAGSVLVNDAAIFTGFPGKFLKLRYNRASGGAGDSRVTCIITTW